MMTTDKAYILGLLIGGGIWGNAEDILRIRFPFKQWGSYLDNPQRAGQISQDILRNVGPMFRAIYGLNVSYEASKAAWFVLCEGDTTALQQDLSSYGIVCEGELRKTASIDRIVPELVDDNIKRRFIAGLADTIGSTKPSHRRFDAEKQMVSFEISGFQFGFVCSLCNLLHSINCFPDQILWNHPNFHCASNPYDKKWKKGFKLRVFLDQYDKFGAFAFTSKVLSVRENKLLESEENKAVPCDTRSIRAPHTSCVHCDENSSLLPENIRGGHYFHNRHVCAVLNCSHAPYSEVEKLLENAEYYFNPFPVLVKGRQEEIQKIIDDHPIFKNRAYSVHDVELSFLAEYEKNFGNLLYGDGEKTGYPINKIMLAVTYLIAANNGQVNGSRPKGEMSKIIGDQLSLNPSTKVRIEKPDLLTPLRISMGSFSTLVGPNNPTVYKKLITRCPDNNYKISIREITEDDIR